MGKLSTCNMSVCMYLLEKDYEICIKHCNFSKLYFSIMNNKRFSVNISLTTTTQ